MLCWQTKRCVALIWAANTFFLFVRNLQGAILAPQIDEKEGKSVVSLLFSYQPKINELIFQVFYWVASSLSVGT